MRRRILLLLPLLLAPSAAVGQDAPSIPWQSANLAYLGGFNWSTAEAVRDVLTFEYANRWGWGDNFVFVDVFNLLTSTPGAGGVGQGGTSTYGEWHARLSLGRLRGAPLAAGPLRDVLLANELNFSGSGLFAHLHGIGIDWAVPGLTFLRTNLYVRNDVARSGVTAQALVSGLATLRVGGVPVSYGGFVDLIGGEGGAVAGVFSGTQLLVDAGALLGGAPGHLLVGTELHVGRNQAGLRANDDLVPQAMVKWVF